MALPKLLDSAGRVVPLHRELASGGEGIVYTLVGDASQVAKVYLKTPTAEKVEKLTWMVAHADEKLTAVAAWPTGLLLDARSKKPVGFLMPMLSGFQPIHHLYNPAQRLRYFPRSPWNFLVQAAYNTAAAFDELHQAGVLVGDINQSNLRVSHQALVRLIDCDSFQVTVNGRHHLCEVGVAHYTPPELQGKSFVGVVRTLNMDRFGLAVVLFQLLFLGRHPYAGVFQGKGDLSFEDAIAQYRFAYGPRAASVAMAAPPFTLAFEDLPPAAGELFARAFERGSEVDRRPTAGEWCAVLGQLADDLATCKADPGHRFWTGATDCPWCRIVARRGPDYFLGVSETAFVFLPDEPRLRELLRQLAEIEQTSLTTKIPPPALLIPPPSVIPRAIPPGMDRDLPLSIGFILSAALGGVVSLGCCLSVYALIIGLVLFVGSLIGFALVIWSSPFYREYSRRHQALVTSRREFHTAETLYLDSILELREGLDTGIHQARDLIDRCRLLPKQYQEEVADLANHLEELARKAHLANYFLTDATIPKIGDGRKQTLASHNINTAADIDPAVLCQIKGFGRALIEYLMQWREQCLEGFTFDRTQKVPEANQRAVAMAFSRKQRTLLGEAERQLDDLRQANAHLESERTRHLPRYQEAFTQALQAEADWNLFCEAYPMFKQAGR